MLCDGCRCLVLDLGEPGATRGRDKYNNGARYSTYLQRPHAAGARFHANSFTRKGQINGSSNQRINVRAAQ